MYHFLQFKPDKSEPWRMYTVDQIAKGDLPGLPSFKTVLTVDQNPEDVTENGLDAIETVTYMGPMYLDFDDSDDINRVLDDVNAVLDYLMNKLDIPEQFIHCYLSGGKGIHITIPETVFGLKKPAKFLPMIYKEIMLTIQTGAGLDTPSTLDTSVYSCGRGRMWRCEGVARPGSGTYKVATTPSELADMNSEEYFHIVASPRPTQATPYPAKSVTFPKAEKLLKAARVAATRKVRAMKEQCTVPKEVMREWDGVPGCAEILITQGDCQGSNWNQAAMQLASYIAARYERSEEKEYMEALVHPFVKNVTSSSRPSESERLKHVKEQLNRTFRGTFKFSQGAFIAAIGEKCGACPICRSDIADGSSSQEDAAAGNFNADVKIRFDHNGYHLVAEEGSRQLTNFTFWPSLEVYELEQYTTATGHVGWRNTERKELVGKLFVAGAAHAQEITIPERAWSSKRDLITAVKGRDAAVYAGDAEIQKIFVAMIKFARDRADEKELEKMVRANVCGIVMDRSGKKTVAHYIEAGNAVTMMGTRSPYRYDGNARQSPSLLAGKLPEEDDKELEIAIRALCKVNEPVQVALMIGWFASCHYREHIQFEEPQFPLLNIYGNAGSGKSCLALLIAMINGIDYLKAELQNVEVGTLFPLTKYVSSSTTVPRIVEEVNPTIIGPIKYNQILGIFKAAWSHSPIQRGRLMDNHVGVTEDRVSAPLVYTSEQSATVTSLRNRSVEVRLQAKTLLNPVHKENYRTAVKHRESLLRLAKAMVNVALHTSPTALLKTFHEKAGLITADMEERSKWGMQCCLTGLHMMIHTMKEYKVGGVEDVEGLYQTLVAYLGGEVRESERGKSVSEVGRVLDYLNTMADPTFEPRFKMEKGDHYWRAGDSLYLVLQSCMPKYVGYSKSIGESPVIRQFQQMTQLIEGEIYYVRTEAHPTRENVDVFVLDAKKLVEKGTSVNNFLQEEAPDA